VRTHAADFQVKRVVAADNGMPRNSRATVVTFIAGGLDAENGAIGERRVKPIIGAPGRVPGVGFCVAGVTSGPGKPCDVGGRGEG